MADPRGFLKFERKGATRRPPELRIQDWKEVYLPTSDELVTTQAARCMDCGIPFCHQGCPLGNLIPEWNNLTYLNEWKDSIDRLHATNNFPEFTGRLCPAPCETACVLGISDDPVSIKLIEQETIEHAFARNLVKPVHATKKSSKKIAVVGSGPSGLAAAQQLTRAGHDVVVYEKNDRVGGLLRYGIPEFKMEKAILERRLVQMREEGTIFVTNTEIGKDITIEELKANFDAVVLALGSEVPRDLRVEGRHLGGIHQAMEFLPLANRVQEGDFETPALSAEGKRVVIIGGGDTGADCLGTSHRQGAKSVMQIEIMPRPTDERPTNAPWPLYPMLYRISSAHEEGGVRDYAINTEEFLGDEDGNVVGIKAHRIELKSTDKGTAFEKIEGSDFIIEADMVLFAMGFIGTPLQSHLEDAGIKFTPRGSVATNNDWMTERDGIFAAGDVRRGQSLIVWAIAEGRSVAHSVDRYLMGDSDLPAPISTNSFALSL
ncbi:MAG: glutamate synthase subunit beta [Actinomycetota bacterium]|nr:glutamate synthase subunit beta [Actinomycetota bacterium]